MPFRYDWGRQGTANMGHMTDRDTFAAAALTGLLADDGDRIDPAMSDFTRRAYEWADAMLLERGVWPEINRLCTERDEARREACRQWLMRQCELEAHRGTNIELRRLSKIYRDNFGGEYGDDSGYNRDLPPYEWADAMLLERLAVACEPTEPTKPTLTNDERAAVEAILSDPDLVLGDTREPLRCLLERLSHHFPDAGNMVTTLTNDERMAIAYGVAALQSAGNYEIFAKDTLRKLLERTA